MFLTRRKWCGRSCASAAFHWRRACARLLELTIGARATMLVVVRALSLFQAGVTSSRAIDAQIRSLPCGGREKERRERGSEVIVIYIGDCNGLLVVVCREVRFHYFLGQRLQYKKLLKLVWVRTKRER